MSSGQGIGEQDELIKKQLLKNSGKRSSEKKHHEWNKK
jgi:hypothetical protein